ncbi:MAG: 4-hydroxy-tetrahydrodipicolinate synthase [Endomicrobium sp.]|jgi:4-hydroxy-tetrahydrodipicolinate synthase|nr:4-hydroxy-tetrahydrodipicolinate synthase [Endomicrobium sp.]
MFFGVYTALITPFKNNKIDFHALDLLLEKQLINGVQGIVPCGTTGESVTLEYEEYISILKFCVKKVNKKIKIIAGAGSNCTYKTVHLSKIAEDLGCDGVLVVSPYYNKPTQKGLYLHFKAINEAINIPIIIYNIPSRSSINIEPKTIAKIFNDCKNVVGIKESSGSLNQVNDIKLLSHNIVLFSGDDALTLPLLALGGVGVISVLSNIIPDKIVKLVKFFRMGNINEAMRIHYNLLPLIKVMFLETNPLPIKTAASILGICEMEFRLPMCKMEHNNRLYLEKKLREYKLLK